MRKNALRGYIVLVVIFALFSLISFVAPFSRNNDFWFAYVFGVIAVIAQLYFFRTAFTTGNSSRSRFYGFPIVRVGIIYLVLQIVASFAEMVLSEHIPTWIVVGINAIILAFAVIGCVTVEMARDEVERQERQKKIDVSSYKELQTLINGMRVQCNNDELIPIIDDLCEAFKYGDPVSNEACADYEKELRELLISLQDAVMDNDQEGCKKLSVKIRATLMERNRICKISK